MWCVVMCVYGHGHTYVWIFHWHEHENVLCFLENEKVDFSQTEFKERKKDYFTVLAWMLEFVTALVEDTLDTVMR